MNAKELINIRKEQFKKIKETSNDAVKQVEAIKTFRTPITGEELKKHIKPSKTDTSSEGSITTKGGEIEEYRPPSFLDWIFPPVGMWNLLQNEGELPKKTTTLPTEITLKGDDEFVDKFKDVILPQPTPQPTPQPDLFGGDMFGKVGGLVKTVIIGGVVISALGLLKGIFK